jgi:hypothetical protein
MEASAPVIRTVIQNQKGGRGHAPAGTFANSVATSNKTTTNPMQPHEGK